MNSLLFIVLSIFFIIHIVIEIREEIKDYKREHQWDKWDKIKGAFDIINAERGR